MATLKVSNDIYSILLSMQEKLDRIEKKIDEWDYEEDESEHDKGNQFLSEEQIRKLGQKIPYNKLSDEWQIVEFKEFLSHVRTNERFFSAKEIEFAGYADKNFSDVRISDNTRRILNSAYKRAYKKDWHFKFERGFMIKYSGQIMWEWEGEENG